MSKLLTRISKLFSRRSEQKDPTEWHEVRLLWGTKRMENGELTHSGAGYTVYRRLKEDGTWAYKEEPEHEDEFYHRQW